MYPFYQKNTGLHQQVAFEICQLTVADCGFDLLRSPKTREKSGFDGINDKFPYT